MYYQQHQFNFLELAELQELPEDAQYRVVPKSPHVSRSIFNHSLDDSLNERAPYFSV
ncbi:MAG: hypothetical protein K0U37_01390 [Gammaproteobacteria bacterium]|nr:hypothetical protein [Gammaproteobacteria bacterium]